MKILKATLLSTALISSTAMADLGDKIERNWENSTGISKLYGGFSNTTFNVGVSHERRQGSLGVDALVMSSGDNGKTGTAGEKNRQLMVASSLVHHLEDNSNADVYLGTGIAAIRHEDVGTSDDTETTFGPLFRIGSSYYLNRDWSVGLEYMTALNWSNDDLASENAYGFVTLGYTY
jgi:hypothetical protein